MKISLWAFGCRTNQAEIEELKTALGNEGIVFVGPREKADIYVINCCSVTAGAERDTRRMFNKIKNQNPKAKIYALGCLRDKNQPNINGYFKNWQKFVKNNIKTQRVVPTSKNTKNKGRTKSFIKIQDGCIFNCAYCITRLLRGKNMSKSPKEIINLIKQKEKEGCKEIVLTGINILLYKYRQTDFKKLLEKILQETTVPRLRFGSLDPRLINDKIINLWKNERLMPHVHLSVQSGSNKILRLMNRNFPIEKIGGHIKKFKKIRKNMGLSCDIIVGFPEEKEKDFKNTLDFVKKYGFFKIHAFPYSNRPGTKAEKMRNQVKENIKKERMKKILEIDKKLRKKFQQKLLNKNISVLWEGKKNNFWLGHTENFLKIKKKSIKNLTNQVELIKLAKKNLFDH